MGLLAAKSGAREGQRRHSASRPEAHKHAASSVFFPPWTAQDQARLVAWDVLVLRTADAREAQKRRTSGRTWKFCKNVGERGGSGLGWVCDVVEWVIEMGPCPPIIGVNYLSGHCSHMPGIQNITAQYSVSLSSA